MSGVVMLLRRRWPQLLMLALLAVLASGCVVSGPDGKPASVPKIDVSVDPTTANKDQLAGVLQLFLVMTVLSLAPALFMLMTSFTRTVIVLSLVRSAIGVQTMPPNQVLVGLALFMTFFIMGPTWNEAKTNGLDPFFRDEISLEVAQERTMRPFREFMFTQTRQADLAMFLDFSGKPRPQTPDDIPNDHIIPAFVVSELSTAFQMGLLVFLPFLIIDLVAAAILMSMGMLMVSPAQIALPFKLLVFVLMDGWHLVVESLLVSYR